MSKPGYRPDIDGLRALAVIAVLLFHLEVPGFGFGYLGVDAFFVISGYLITSRIKSELAENRRFSAAEFYLRRARRLFPALFATLCTVFAAGIAMSSANDLKSLGAVTVHALTGLANVYFWVVGDYFAIEAAASPLRHTWSLGVEEQFYLVWPWVVVYVLARLRRIAALGVLLLLAAGSLYLNHFAATDSLQLLQKHLPGLRLLYEKDSATTAFFLTPFRIYQFSIGAALVWLIDRQPSTRITKELTALCGLSLIALSISGWGLARPLHYRGLTIALGTALVMYAESARYVTAVLKNRLIVGIGLVSYSLYLAHWPLIIFYRYNSPDALSWLEQLSLATASIAIAVGMYFFIEKPFRYPPVRETKPAVGFGTCCALLTVLLMLPAANAWASAGWLWRFPAELQQLLSVVNFDRHGALRVGTCQVSNRPHPPQNVPRYCYRVPDHDKRKSILIVGDSTGAALWHGFNHVLTDYKILQFTRKLCPAILGYDRPGDPGCRRHNQYLFFNVLKRNHYDLVVFSSKRFNHRSKLFERTKRRLRRLRQPFVVLGRPIHFAQPPPQLVANYGRLAGLSEYLGTQMITDCRGEHGRNRAVNPKQFFSMKDAQCRRGLPIYGNKGELFYFDDIHLTTAGSRHVAHRFKHWLRDNLPPTGPPRREIVAGGIGAR